MSNIGNRGDFDLQKTKYKSSKIAEKMSRALSVDWGLLSAYVMFLAAIVGTSIIDMSISKYGLIALALTLAILVLASGYGFMRLFLKSSINWSFIEQSAVCATLGIGILILTYVSLIPFGHLQKSEVSWFIVGVVSITYLGAMIMSQRSDKQSLETRKTFPQTKRILLKIVLNPCIVVLTVVMAISMVFRFNVVLESYPLLPGYDTPAYARTVSVFIQQVPAQDLVMGGMPFTDPPLYYIATAILVKLFGSAWAIPIFYTFVDSLMIFPLFLFYKAVSKDSRVAVFGAALYSFSYFSIRIFQDLQKQVLANFFLPLGFYCFLEGVEKNNSNQIILAGLIFGLASNTHYWVSLIVPVYLGLFTIVMRRHQFTAALKSTLVVLTLMLVTLIPEELFYSLTGGQSWLNTLSSIIIPPSDSTPGLFNYASAQTLQGLHWLMPSIGHVVMFDLLFLTIGSIFLIRKRKRLGLWFLLASLLTLIASRSFELGILPVQSYRMLLYYGLFISLLQASFFIGLYKFLRNLRFRFARNRLNMAELRLPSTKPKAQKTAKLESSFMIIILCIFTFFADVYLYLPMKRDFGLPFLDRGISLGPAITEKQNEALLWLKSHISESDYIITHIQLWSNVLFVFSGFDRITFYNSEPSGYGYPPAEYILCAYHIVSRDSEFYNSTSFFSSITYRLLILMPSVYDGETARILYGLSNDSRFELVFSNDDTRIFVFFPKLPSFSIVDTSAIEMWTTDTSDNVKQLRAYCWNFRR